MSTYRSTTGHHPHRIRTLICGAALLVSLQAGLASAATQDDGEADSEATSEEQTRKKRPSPMAQLTLSAQGTIRPLATQNTDATGGTVARSSMGLTLDARLFSVLGLRGGFDAGLTPDMPMVSPRAGVAAHFLKSTKRPDLYAYFELGLNLRMHERELHAVSREISGGMGFRGRIGRHVMVGIEVGLVQEGLTKRAMNLQREGWAPEGYGPHFGPEVSIQVGFVY